MTPEEKYQQDKRKAEQAMKNLHSVANDTPLTEEGAKNIITILKEENRDLSNINPVQKSDT